jgi:diketogulonate reductase-like aldo/keto reductase
MRALVFSHPPTAPVPTLHPVQQLLYGTAWKKDLTHEITFRAIENGFTSFDTAAQPKSYREDLVGDAIRKAFRCGKFKTRSEIWVCARI